MKYVWIKLLWTFFELRHVIYCNHIHIFPQLNILNIIINHAGRNFQILIILIKKEDCFSNSSHNSMGKDTRLCRYMVNLYNIVINIDSIFVVG